MPILEALEIHIMAVEGERQLILQMSVSPDGFVARSDGTFDWPLANAPAAATGGDGAITSSSR